MSEFVTVEVSDGIARVVLQQPAMPPDFFDAIGDAFRALAKDRSVRVVVLSSAAKHFSVGLDLAASAGVFAEQVSGGLAATRLQLYETIKSWQRSLDEVAKSPVPVIAAIHGACIDGGLDLVSPCDLRLCTSDAKFSLRETRVAIVADVGSLQRLPRIIGDGLMRELAFTGCDVDAARALKIGLVNDVVADKDALAAAATALAKQVAANAPLTVRGVKRLLDHARDPEIAAGLEHVATWNAAFLASEDLGEALSAFIEKRPPEFQGK